MQSTSLLYPVAALLLGSSVALAGPPFQTDDPEPIEYQHFEFYTFGSSDGTALETDTFGPAVELNWGGLPDVHLHIIVPAAGIFPSEGPRAFGLGDIETGVKYRFIHETEHHPMVGTFVMFEIPTGSPIKGLGVGKPWAKIPLWVQKSFGPWTTYGGGGVTVIKAEGYRNFPFAGWLVQRNFGKKWTVGTEVFYHGPEGIATPQTRPATMVDVGGYYKFYGEDKFQLLYCYGHTVVGQRENYAYLGLYWTWGPEAAGQGSSFNRLGPPGVNGGF